MEENHGQGRARSGIAVMLLAAGLCACVANEPESAAVEAAPTGWSDLGTPVTSHAQIAAWDIAIPPSGAGLPDGAGTADAGRSIFEEDPNRTAPDSVDGLCQAGSPCAACHGKEGAGTEYAPRLVGGHPLDPTDPVRTVGSYWPYATTLFDYVRRAMPFDCPGSLSNDQVYAVTAYLLFLNGIIEAHETVDRNTLPLINARMPNHENFYPTPPPHLPKGSAPQALTDEPERTPRPGP